MSEIEKKNPNIQMLDALAEIGRMLQDGRLVYTDLNSLDEFLAMLNKVKAAFVNEESAK